MGVADLGFTAIFTAVLILFAAAFGYGAWFKRASSGHHRHRRGSKGESTNTRFPGAPISAFPFLAEWREMAGTRAGGARGPVAANGWSG